MSGTQAPPPPRRKSCAACIKAKRRCDLRVPACSRCLTRRLDCSYPPRPAPPMDTSPQVSPTRNMADRHEERYQPPAPRIAEEPPQQETPLPPWLAHPSTDYLSPSQILASREEDERLHRLHHNPLPSSVQADVPDLDNMSFLHPTPTPPVLSLTCGMTLETFPPPPEIEMARIPHDRQVFAQQKLQSFPRTFVKTGGTPFIAARLYEEDGLPQPLEDAFVACAAYYAKSDATARIALHILDTAASAVTMPRATWSLAEHLVGLQSLLLVQIIRLFDGDIHARAAAEEHNAILRQWTESLRLRFEREEGLSQSTSSTTSTAIAPDPSWHTWLFGESVRRTLVVSLLLQGVYNTSKIGVCGTQGVTDTLSFTAAAALWNASTAFHWARAWRDRNHWDVHTMRFDHVLQDAKRSEIDDLGFLLLVMYRGFDAAHEWMARKAEAPIVSTFA